MNNKEYKKKRLAVVLADSKVTAKTRFVSVPMLAPH
jgi:hypothetical protein